jgi:hypothetical protein
VKLRATVEEKMSEFVGNGEVLTVFVLRGIDGDDPESASRISAPDTSSEPSE